MRFDKTKHWVLDPALSARAPETALRPREAQAPSDALPLRDSTRIYQTADLLGRQAASAARKPAVGTATRIMPIERLLVDVREPKVAGGQTQKPLRPGSAKRMQRELSSDGRARLRRAVALAALAGSAVFAYLSPFDGIQASAYTRDRAAAVTAPSQAHAHFAPPAPLAEPAAPVRRIDTDPAVSSARARSGAESPPRTQRVRASVPARDPLPRSAADAVARGDYAGAVRAYDQLAARQPDHAVYAEAARILRSRLVVRAR